MAYGASVGDGEVWDVLGYGGIWDVRMSVECGVSVGLSGV